MVHRDVFNSVKTVTQLSIEIEDSTRRKFSITLQVTSRFRRVPLKGNRVTVSYVGSKIVGNTARVFETRKWLSPPRLKRNQTQKWEKEVKTENRRKVCKKWHPSFLRSLSLSLSPSLWHVSRCFSWKSTFFFPCTFKRNLTIFHFSFYNLINSYPTNILLSKKMLSPE